MGKRSKEQNRKQKKVDRENNPYRTTYEVMKSKHKSKWQIAFDVFRGWAKMVGWRRKKGTGADDYCISKRDFDKPYTKNNIKLRKRREHSSEARSWGHKKSKKEDQEPKGWDW